MDEANWLKVKKQVDQGKGFGSIVAMRDGFGVNHIKATGIINPGVSPSWSANIFTLLNFPEPTIIKQMEFYCMISDNTGQQIVPWNIYMTLFPNSALPSISIGTYTRNAAFSDSITVYGNDGNVPLVFSQPLLINEGVNLTLQVGGQRPGFFAATDVINIFVHIQF